MESEQTDTAQMIHVQQADCANPTENGTKLKRITSLIDDKNTICWQNLKCSESKQNEEELFADSSPSVGIGTDEGKRRRKGEAEQGTGQNDIK